VVGRPLWAWRVELAALLLTVALLRWLTARLGVALAVLAAGGLALGLAMVPAVRRWVLLLARRSHVRRQWTLAVRHAGLANFNDRVPRVVGHRLTLAGDDLAVRVPAGKTVSEVEDKAETIAAFLRVREVRVHRRPEDAGLAQVMVVVRDPLDTTERWPWPNLGAERLSLWQPVPVGLDEDGKPVTLSLVERNILYGGEPGSGKSVAQSLGTATAALDPEVRLHLFDGKYVELAPWAGCAEHMIGSNQDEAIDVLKLLVADMDGRYMQLLANKRRKLRAEDGLPLHVVEIDELAFFCNGPNRAANKEFTELARDLVGRGRAAGYIVKAATQKPSGDTIPTYLRDLFAIR
jgi:FtsK/SpoIIIE family